MNVQVVKIKCIASFLWFVSGCCSAQSVSELGIEKSWALAVEQNIASDARHYLKRWLFNGENWKVGKIIKLVVWPEDEALQNCVTAIFPGPREARMVFILNADGVITEGISNHSGYINDCIKEKVVGLKMPAPPFSPYFICSGFEKTGENNTKVAGCGEKHYEKSCVQTGASASCILKEIN